MRWEGFVSVCFVVEEIADSPLRFAVQSHPLFLPSELSPASFGLSTEISDLLH